jgi:NAD-dependent dihydropyrimidine dehydrogenase PreA subunit
VTYTITEPCVDIKDKTCIDECPVDCIYEGERMLYIHPDECVDCGACEPVCPVEAIHYEDDVPEQWAPYTQINAEFFAELGRRCVQGRHDRQRPAAGQESAAAGRERLTSLRVAPCRQAVDHAFNKMKSALEVIGSTSVKCCRLAMPGCPPGVLQAWH